MSKWIKENPAGTFVIAATIIVFLIFFK